MPSEVSFYATSGTFTIAPAMVAARIDSTTPMRGIGGTVQNKQGSTEGIRCINAYDQPDGWKLITYAEVPFEASTPPRIVVCRNVIVCPHL